MSTSERHWQGIDPRLRQDWRQISDEEWRARHEEYKKAIAEIDAQEDTPDEWDRSDDFLEEIAMSTQSHAADPQVPQPVEVPPVEQAVSASGPATDSDRQVAEWPHRDIDPRTGRLRSITAEEWRARMEQLTQDLAEIDANDDTPEDVYDAVMRGIDEERRIQGRPPAFEGYY